MRTSRTLLWRVLALLAALALVAAACGDDDDDGGASDDAADTSGDGGDASSDGGGAPLEQLDFSGLDVAVGSKDFTEQLVLGEILVQALEAGGASVDNQVNLGGTSVNRDALLSGGIDAYWEYNGTGWTVHLAQEDPSFDPEQLTADVAEMDLAENSIRWIGRSPFNDTYGFTSSPALTEENGGPFTLEDMAQYLQDNPDATVCLETEFPNRPDGLVLFEEAYGYDVPDSQIETLETGVIYQETADDNCDFGEVFTTDGRIPGLGLSLVEDPGVFILYNVSLTMPDDVYQQAPDAFDELVDQVLTPLDEETMAELNRRVSLDGEDAADVANDYLVSEGLISG